MPSKLVDHLTAKPVNHLTAKQVNIKPQSFRLTNTPPTSCCRTIKPWSCRQNTQAKIMAVLIQRQTSLQDCLPKLRGNNDCTKAKHSPCQQRNKRLEQTAKQWESDDKRMIQRLNEKVTARELLYWAHGGDASKADRTWAKPLTADHARAPRCQLCQIKLHENKPQKEPFYMIMAYIRHKLLI